MGIKLTKSLKLKRESKKKRNRRSFMKSSVKILKLSLNSRLKRIEGQEKSNFERNKTGLRLKPKSESSNNLNLKPIKRQLKKKPVNLQLSEKKKNNRSLKTRKKQ